jgi:uncharacterized protein
VEIEFDLAKDAVNRAKHGVPLARAAELTDVIVVEDDRFGEQRYRLYGWIDDVRYCAAVTLRGDIVRVISLRRAHRKEFNRHGH